jgi:hypothetical protein
MFCRVLLMGVLMVSAASLSAQQGETLGGPATVEGCLEKNDQTFTLTERQTGTIYYLVGNSDAFQQHSGKEVTLFGTSSRVVQSDTGVKSSNASSGTLPTFQVRSLKQIADSCSPK